MLCDPGHAEAHDIRKLSTARERTASDSDIIVGDEA
jgi:hypothetical protein